MQDRPTAPELLDAMAAQLFGEVREWVPRERRFQVLVLANLCAVIARELRAGETPSEADAELFARLAGNAGAGGAGIGSGDGFGADRGEGGEGSGGARGTRGEAGGDTRAAREEAARLAAMIRRGDLDDRLDEVVEGLREHVARKLDVARPGYADPFEK